MAQRGGVNVLSGAPYGYRYVKKSETAAAFYEVVESEAKVVRLVYEKPNLCTDVGRFVAAKAVIKGSPSILNWC